MLIEHRNFNRKDYEVIMQINSDNYRLFHCKFYFFNPHYDIFRNMYFKNRVGDLPKSFVLR